MLTFANIKDNSYVSACGVASILKHSTKEKDLWNPLYNASKGRIDLLYRFQIELSDVDRGIYQTLDFRLAQHPSETLTYLLTKFFAYVLNYESGLQFSPGGLSDPDAPALQKTGDNGSTELWIEVGNPSAKKLHKATKTAKQVIIYTYKSVPVLLEDIKNNEVHRAGEIKIISFDPKFLQSLEQHVGKNNRWSILHQQDQLDINMESVSFSSVINRCIAPGL